METPSAIPNGCPRNLRGAAGNYVIGEDWVHSERPWAWCTIEKLKQRLPDVYPAFAICALVNKLMRKMCEWQIEWAWTFDPVSITGRKKSLISIEHVANAKQWRVSLFGFPLEGNLVFLRISLRNPLFTDGNHGAIKTGLHNSAAWSQLKHWISKTDVPILMCIFFFFRCTRFILTETFVGGALC